MRGRLTTEPLNFEDIIADIRKGEIKIPKFQRPFVWKEEQAIRLVDSIARGYPVGSVLLWRTADKLSSERELGEFKLPQTDEMTPTKYVLDGQQRITVIYAAFGAEAGDGGFKPRYDLRTEKFISSDETAVHYFPLRFVYRTTDLLNFRTALQALEDRDVLQSRLDALIGAITGYRIPVVELRDLTVEEVCPIFERINSSGTRLSTFDLIAAATWSKTFDLSDQAQAIAKELEPKGFEGISNETILKCISIVLLGSIKKEDVLRLREHPEATIAASTDDTKEALRKTIDLLQKEFSIQAMSFLPYEAHMICLAKVFEQSPRMLDGAQYDRLRQWFWRTAFSEHFRGASEAFVSTAAQEAVDWILRGEGRAESFGIPLTPDKIVATKFHFRAAVAKAFVLALAAAKPRNITNGAAVDLVECLSVYNNKQYHHIFPQAWLKGRGETRIDSLANICMLSASENVRISDTSPNDYLPVAATNLNSGAGAVFASNLMPSPTVVDYGTIEFAEFLSERATLIARQIEVLCG